MSEIDIIWSKAPVSIGEPGPPKPRKPKRCQLLTLFMKFCNILSSSHCQHYYIAHHQNSCLLHISACNGLTGLTRLTPQQQWSAMWSFRNILTRRNIEIQIYSSHSIHVLVLNGSTDIVKEISEIGIKVDYNINVLKELLLLGALTDMWSWNGHSVELAGWWREFHLTDWVWCV